MSQKAFLCNNGRPSTSDRPFLRQHVAWQNHAQSFKSGPQRRFTRQRKELCLRALDTETVSRSDGMDLNVEQAGPSTSKAQQAIAVFKASRSATEPVTPGPRPLGEYMTLPASQYSVLDAKKIERIDENTFRCHVGGLHFFSFVVEPVLTVSVMVGDRGPTVKLLETKLEGSPSVVAANDKFEATMTNVVRWDTSAEGELELRSDTDIQVTLEVPSWFRIIPLPALEATGSRVMQGVLNTMVPRFLKQLRQDYKMWAAGDNSRKPLGTGEL